MIYELVVGAPPFIQTTNSDLYSKILHREAFFPGHLSQKCKSFLSGLLKKNPRERFGAKGGLSEIINHPWLCMLNYGQIILKKIKSPIQPDPYSLNFDNYFLSKKIDPVHDITGNPDGQEKETRSNPSKAAVKMRFENFSFYSNIENPSNKYLDTLLDVPDNLSRENSIEKSGVAVRVVKSDNILSRRRLESAVMIPFCL